MPATPILDGHNDVLLALERADRAGEPSSFFGGLPGGHLDYPRARRGGFTGGFFACFVPPDLDAPAISEEDIVRTGEGYEIPYAEAVDPGYARDVTMRLGARLLALEAESAGRMRVVRTAADVEACLTDGVLAAIWHLEGGDAIDPDRLDLLHVLHAAGLRSLGIVWSRPNAFGEGVPFRFPGSPDTGPGLTDAGRQLVRACNGLRILVDLSHLNERGFWDVAEVTDAPLIATHSAAHALTPSTRNLTDAQLDAIGRSGGVVGVNLNVADLRPDGRGDALDMPLEHFVAHAEHIAGRIGVEHVALGSDFDGAPIADAVGDVAGVPRLLDALAGAGWNEHDLRGFAHGNWLRVLRATWGG